MSYALNRIYCADSISAIAGLEEESVQLFLSDIPYGIGAESWDVLHANTNSALLGESPAQKKAGSVFKKRGKPLNGWSAADKSISRQYYSWVASWCGRWLRALVPGGSAFVFAGRRMAHRCISAFEDAGFIFKDMLAWDKMVAPHRAQRISVVYGRRGDRENAARWDGWRVGNLRPIFEPILWFEKPYPIGTTIADNMLKFGVGAYHEEILAKYGQNSDNIFHVRSEAGDSGLHPTQKPLRLMELLVEMTTNKNDLVVDPFAGSGTTLVAARRLGRNYIGFECNEGYHRRAEARLTSDMWTEGGDLCKSHLQSPKQQDLFPAWVG